MKKQEQHPKYSRKKRRKKFFNKVSMDMYHKAKGDSRPVFGVDICKVCQKIGKHCICNEKSKKNT